MKIKVVDVIDENNENNDNTLAIEDNKQYIINDDEDYNKISKNNVDNETQEESGSERPSGSRSATSIQTIQDNIVEEDKTKRIQQLHKCDKCGKMLTLKSLRYSHSKYCGNNNKPTKMIPQPKNQEVIQQVKIPDIEETPIIKSLDEMRRDRYLQRQNEKKESIKRLFANAV